VVGLLLLLDGSVHTEVGLLLLLNRSVRKRWAYYYYY